MVSIILPTYNRACLLSVAIKSVLSQSYADWELLVVDDGSSDDTHERMSEFLSDSRIMYFHKENGGQGSARNLGIRESHGEFLAFLDSDDEWMPLKLERQVNFLQEHPTCDFCYTASIIYQDSIPTNRIVGSGERTLREKLLRGESSGSLSSVLFRKSSFNKLDFFDESRDLIGLEDNEFGIRVAGMNGSYIREPLTVYRLHASQITKENMLFKAEKQRRGLVYILEKHAGRLQANSSALSFRLRQVSHLSFLLRDYHAARKYALDAYWQQPLSLVSALFLVLVYSRFFYVAALRVRKALINRT